MKNTHHKQLLVEQRKLPLRQGAKAISECDFCWDGGMAEKDEIILAHPGHSL